MIVNQEVTHNSPISVTIEGDQYTHLVVDIKLTDLWSFNAETRSKDWSEVILRIKVERMDEERHRGVEYTLQGKTESPFTKGFLIPLGGPANCAIKITVYKVSEDGDVMMSPNRIRFDAYELKNVQV